MSFLNAIAGSQSGGIAEAAAAAAGVSVAEAEQVITAMSPVIARQLKAKAEANPEAFEDLLDLLEDNANDIDADAIAGPEAVSDGNAILTDIYGSRNAAITEMRKAAGDMSESALTKLAAISATAVLASLARSHSGAMPLSGAQTAAGDGGGGLLGTIVQAVIKGAVQGAARQLAPKRRRRRSYGGYFGTRKRRATRRRRRTGINLDAIFRDILGGSR
ncbi:MAG: DUF937 domain-containing protein [Rhodospirillales bacterium]|nr:DUF937 domain-containing protein [Rhodospirillales bacterium]